MVSGLTWTTTKWEIHVRPLGSTLGWTRQVVALDEIATLKGLEDLRSVNADQEYRAIRVEEQRTEEDW